jgi:BioD-like phosphotransacetylase family protein
VAQTVICAMTPHNAVKYIQDKTLLLIPGDRDDLVFAAITTALLRKDVTISGIILTGGLQLAAPTRELLMRTDIPLLAMDRPTYEAATELHDITIKIQEGDREKVRLAGTLVAAHVDLERIWKML